MPGLFYVRKIKFKFSIEIVIRITKSKHVHPVSTWDDCQYT